MSIRKLNMTFVVVVAVAAGAFGLSLFFPGLRELENRRAEIGRELDRNQQMQASVGDVTNLFAAVAELKRNAVEHERRIPTEPKSGDFMNGITKCLKASGIERYDIQPEQVRPIEPAKLPESLKLASNIAVVPVRLKFESTFQSVFELLAGVEQLPRLVHVDSLKVVNDESSPGRVKVEMTLQAYQSRPG